MTEHAYRALVTAIHRQLQAKEPVIVAIDGRCGSGKTTLAARLQDELSGAVFHMDDFFLRPEQRTDESLSQPGGNVDHERFLAEVLLPLRQSEGAFSYRPYLCAQQALGAAIHTAAGRLNIVEGSYSCHPLLWEHYDLRVFLTIEPDEQLRRIEKRSGSEKAKQFRDRWIPLEERYFEAFDVQARCDMCIGG